MLGCFLYEFQDAKLVCFDLALALVISIPLWLGFLFSFMNSQTRFKKLGAVLWSILTAFVLGTVAWAVFRAQYIDVFDLWKNITPVICFAAIVPVFLATSAFGRVFKRKKKLHWLVFPVSFVVSFALVVVFGWALLAEEYGSYSESVISKEEMEQSEGFDFEIRLGRGSYYDDISLKIRGKVDSVYYQVKYDLCPYVLDNKDFIAKYTEPLENVATPWTLLDKEKSSIAFELRKSMMTYESEWTTVMVLDGYCIGLGINDFQKKKSRHFSFCNADISNVPKAYAMEKMANSLWPARETYTKYSYEQAEKACRESQNYTGE
ncbi:tripartite tricarboxylate transporter TctB family protein [Fibrobacter sp. UWH1]|uniref:tripartite tricarboxylate transporter TctB family protein n=1 Tax=Fibrobacter sp. UWH1 TaxID=1964354 RepID=UPI000B5216A5|nr:hypothetical protein [Fibrobacter sp. UWH1]OWV17441.1 hypothetical protein B7992_00835 [Fibrobacter sp. UWH1]